MAAGFRFGLPFHNGHMGQTLAGSPPCASQLISFEVNQRHIFRMHETLGNQCGGTENQIIPDPDCKVPSIPIGIVFSPHPVADIDHSLLKIV